jgi:hypothetical protein
MNWHFVICNLVISSGPASELTNYKSLNCQLLHFFMRRMLPATPAELFQLQTIRSGLPVFRRRIIALFAVIALHRDNFPRHCELLASFTE